MWWIVAAETSNSAFQALAGCRCCAYIDPGSGSMLLQLLIVGIAGAGIALKYAGGRMLNFLWPFRRRHQSPEEHSPDVAAAADPKDVANDAR